MRKEIEEFCEEIKEAYFLYLYGKGENISFPHCCKLSADLITSFFKLVCSDKFQYICTTNERAYNHAWTYYKDGQEEFIIDFTNLQYTNREANRIKNREISMEELKNLLASEKVVFNPEETYMYIAYDFMKSMEQKCYGVLDKFQGNLNKTSFLEYLKLSYNEVYENTHY